MKLGKRISQLRMEKGLSQRELGEIFSVTQQAVNRWENGQGNPDLNTLNKLADFFGVSTDYLIGRTDIRTLADLKTRDVYQFLQFEDIKFKGTSLDEEDRELIVKFLDLFMQIRQKDN